MRAFRVGILFVLPVLLLGCDEPKLMGPGAWEDDPPPLPADALDVNCVAVRDGPRCHAPFEEAGAVVVARCIEVHQYATVRRGNWDFLWYLVACDVIRVERGRWPHPRVVFCCYDTWPTPESGIKVKKAPFPYVGGRVVALALAPDTEPPRVLGQQQRSRLPPHEKPTYLDPRDEAGERLFHRLWRAVCEFAAQEGWPKVTGAPHFEVTDDAYVGELVVQHPNGESERRAVAVDKETFAVREIP